MCIIIYKFYFMFIVRIHKNNLYLKNLIHSIIFSIKIQFKTDKVFFLSFFNEREFNF